MAKPRTRDALAVPVKWTPEVGQEVCRLVEEIGYLAIAAEMVGVHRQSVYNWQRRGLEGADPELAAFVIQLNKARAKWIHDKLQKVDDARWLLERAEPTLFGPKAEPPVTVNVQQAVLTKAQALARLTEIAKDDPSVVAAVRAAEEITP